MALTPEYAQASARAPRPSQPPTGSPMSSAPVSPYHQQGSTMPSAAPAAYYSRHLVPFASMGGGSPHTLILHRQLGPIPPTHTEPWGGFPKSRWHPRLLPPGRQRHRRARPVLSCRLGLLPPTLYQQWGGAPPWQHAMFWHAHTVTSIWHSPCLNAQDLLMQIHG
jgi:hypothetical protein